MAEKRKLLEFSVPISETSDKENTFLIKGVAINETTTRNGITYIAEELRNAAPSFRDKPLLKDHNNSIDSIVGRTTENIVFDETTNAILFEAMVMDKGIQEKIKNGLIKNVSIGAIIEGVEKKELDDGTEQVIAKGLEGVELSLVAVPGDAGASFDKAMMEMFNLTEKVDEEPKTDLKQEKNKMTENHDIILNENKELKQKIKEMTEEKEAEDEEVKTEELAKNITVTVLEAVDKKFSEMNVKEEAEEEATEEEETEEVAEDADAKVEDKTEGDVVVDEEEVDESLSDTFIGEDKEHLSRGLCIYKENYNDDKYGRLKRW